MSISGDFVTCKINGVNVAGVQKWRAKGGVVRLNGQTAQDQGYAHPKAGTKSVTGSFGLVVDITTGDLSGVVEGTEIAALGLFANIDSAEPIYYMPLALVMGLSPGGEMNGSFTADVEFESVGPYEFNNPN